MKTSEYLKEDELNCLDIYHDEIPVLLQKCLDTEVMKRLRDVGMNCGCEYTSFNRFINLRKYSRFSHSLGVALIVYRFTKDEKQALAGLLHDISTPVFAHVVDFLKGDYLKQEATELLTEDVIASSKQLCTILEEYGLKIEDVSNYHLYPIADNDSPRLSADRLEYTLGNGINYGFCSKAEAKEMYDSLTVCKNEEGTDELCFKDERLAEKFGLISLKCSNVYVSDEDRYAMQILSEILADAVEREIISEQELYETETEIIEKLNSDPYSRVQWQQFRKLNVMYVTENPDGGEGWRMIHAKKRNINPLIEGKGRLDTLSSQFKNEKEAFLNRRQDIWIRGESNN